MENHALPFVYKRSASWRVGGSSTRRRARPPAVFASSSHCNDVKGLYEAMRCASVPAPTKQIFCCHYRRHCPGRILGEVEHVLNSPTHTESFHPLQAFSRDASLRWAMDHRRLTIGISLLRRSKSVRRWSTEELFIPVHGQRHSALRSPLCNLVIVRSLSASLGLSLLFIAQVTRSPGPLNRNMSSPNPPGQQACEALKLFDFSEPAVCPFKLYVMRRVS